MLKSSLFILFLILASFIESSSSSTSTSTTSSSIIPNNKSLTLKCKVHYLNKCDRHCNVCETENLNVTTTDTELVDVTGFSVRNVAFHNNVVRLSINNQACNYIPIFTDKFFPNLETLRVFSSELKQIGQKNLKGFKELRELLVPLNDIESLDSDLFQFNPKIARIDLSNNKLKNVGLALFSSLKLVTFANFKGNDCTNEVLKSDRETFINRIREQCLPTLVQLRSDVIFLAHENEALKHKLEAKETFIKENCKVYHDDYFLNEQQFEEVDFA